MTTESLSLHFTRSVAVATDTKKIYGYAIVYNSKSVDLGGFVEVIAVDAFTEDINTGKNIKCLYEHDHALVLAETEKGTLKLTPDDKGVAFELTLEDSELAESIYAKVKSGEIDGMSFGFLSQIVEWDLNKSIKTVKKATLTEITLTATPAYEMTVALTRSKNRKKDISTDYPKDSIEPIDANLHRLRMLM
jgi:HK97 family phage prohead protease